MKLAGSKREGGVIAVNTGYSVTMADHQRVLNVTASGAAVEVSIPAAGTLPEGFYVVIRRAAGSDSNVTVTGGVSRSLTGAGESLIVEAGAAEWIDYPTVGPAGDTGAAGPNEVTTSTDCNITGLLKGTGTKVAQAGAGDIPAHAASHTNGTDDIQTATAAQKGVMSAAAMAKLDGIETAADVTDATNVAASGAVMDGDFTANGAMERTGAGTYTTILNKRDATTAPVKTNDTTEGYAVGSRWVDVTNDKEYVCLDATVGAAVWTETTQSGGGTVDRSINQFRLTLESGVPVSTTDQTAKTTVYACPTSGGATAEGQIALLGTDDTTWKTHDTAQMSLGLTTTRNGTTHNGTAVIDGLATTVDLVVGQEITGTGVGAGAVIASIDSETQVTASVNSSADGTVSVTFKCPASKNYDLFVVNIAGTPTLVFGPVWTNDTTRATAITQKDGVPVLSGSCSVGGTSYAEGRLRHVGMVRTTTTAGQTELSRGGLDTIGKCFIWSVDNQEDWEFFIVPNAATWSYTTNTWRQVRANANMQIEFISGRSHRPRFTYMVTCKSTATPSVAIDIDSTNTPTDEYPVFGNAGYQTAFADHDAVLSAGYHYAAAIECGNRGATFYGYSADAWKMGLKGRMKF